MQKKYKFLMTGALTGAVNGLLGAGGGMVLVPLLMGWCKLEQRHAFATSVAIILPFCMVSLLLYWQQGTFSVALPYLIGGVLGGLLAGRLFAKVRMIWLRRAFGVLILYGGVRALLLL